MGPLIQHLLASLWLGPPGFMPDLKCLTTHFAHNNGDRFRVILRNTTKLNQPLGPGPSYKCSQNNG